MYTALVTRPVPTAIPPTKNRTYLSGISLTQNIAPPPLMVVAGVRIDPDFGNVPRNSPGEGRPYTYSLYSPYSPFLVTVSYAFYSSHSMIRIENKSRSQLSLSSFNSLAKGVASLIAISTLYRSRIDGCTYTTATGLANNWELARHGLSCPKPCKIWYRS